MDEQGAAATERKRRRRWLGAASLVAAGLVAGGMLAGSQIAGAAAGTSETPAAAINQGAMPSGDPAAMRHGPGETLLNGDTADKVTAAAKEAVPGATVIRVETDSDGAAYEAHMQKDDGTYVTVKLDEDFNVTSTDEGFGGPGGPPSTN